MPPPRTLKIAEIFASIQGEGLRQGLPTIFVRLAGCNLRCSFCDTKDAWTGGRDRPVEEIAAAVSRARKAYPAEWVCLTGGEPLLQDVGPLVRALKKDGGKIQIETNGVFFRPAAVDWYTLSPKPPRYSFRPEYLKKAREVKLVVSRELTLSAVRRIRDEFPAGVPLFLQLESSSQESLAKALRLQKGMLRDGRPDVRLGAQLHKFPGLR